MSHQHGRLSRRRFITIGGNGLCSAILLSARSNYPFAKFFRLAVMSQAMEESLIALSEGAVGSTKLLHNENRAGFYIRYFRPCEPQPIDQWQLRIGGMVANPRSFALRELLDLPHFSISARLKCVEGWSARAEWSGFRFERLASLVNPLPAARFVQILCADGYFEILRIEELSHSRAMMVTHMNGAMLSPEHGAPLRLLVPWKYGYKCAKAIVALEFQERGGRGYWSAIGPFSAEGDIEAGWDMPLDDLENRHRRIPGGEIVEY